jgi:hypothetical protein
MSFGAVRLAIHPCGKPQGILAKANKRISTDKCRQWVDRLRGLSFSPFHLADPLESIRFKKLDQTVSHLEAENRRLSLISFQKLIFQDPVFFSSRGDYFLGWLFFE